MIKNILFDMGNVLIRFDRNLFLDRLPLSPEEKQMLYRDVFAGVEWVQMDRGIKTEQTALESICKRLPEHLHSAAEQLVFHWDEPIVPIAGMYELVAELKENGYGIYLLSNASYRQHEYWPRIAASRFFDGTCVSADEGVVKPQPELYRRCLEKFGLNGEETFFIDDVGANIEAAVYCGLQGAVFYEDVPRLRRDLRSAGVNVSEMR